MEPTLKILAIVLVVASALTASLAAVSPTLMSSAPNANPNAGHATPLDVSGIFYVGSLEGLAGNILSHLESRSGQVATIVTELSGLADIVGLLDASSIVVFQSEWLRGKTNEPALLDFLRDALPTEAKIAAVDGSTSLLFDALDQVRDVFADGRNPAHNNPPVAGYRLRGATTPDGTAYYGASGLVCHPSTAADAADCILGWR